MSFKNNTSTYYNSYYSGFHGSDAVYNKYKMGYWEKGEDPYKIGSDEDDDSDYGDQDRSYVGGFGWCAEFEADLEAERQERKQMAEIEKKRRLYHAYRVAGMTTKDAAAASKLYTHHSAVVDAD